MSTARCWRQTTVRVSHCGWHDHLEARQLGAAVVRASGYGVVQAMEGAAADESGTEAALVGRPLDAQTDGCYGRGMEAWARASDWSRRRGGLEGEEEVGSERHGGCGC